jgi:FkbM family methyltransferase
MASRHFPAARDLLVEAQAAAHGAPLQKLHARRPQMEFVLAAAGAKKGMVHFDDSDPLGGMASEQPLAGPSIEVLQTTIDAEVAARRMPGPFLIKLDTHGFEVPILEGAEETLRQTAVLVIEAYNFDLNATSLRFPHISAWVEKRGFRCVDLADVLYRPRDGALWQMDLFFVRDASLEGPQAYR